MLRSVVAYLFAAALLLPSTSAFRQTLSELRDTEPGSLLFGVLLAVQPLFASMDPKAQQSIWWGAALARRARARLALAPLYRACTFGR